MLLIRFRSMISSVFLKRGLGNELAVLPIKFLVHSFDLELTTLKTKFETRYKVELAESLT